MQSQALTISLHVLTHLELTKRVSKWRVRGQHCLEKDSLADFFARRGDTTREELCRRAHGGLAPDLPSLIFLTLSILHQEILSIATPLSTCDHR